MKKGGQSFTSASEIAEVFNTHFTNIGERLASEIPKVDKEPESFINPTDKTFSFKKIQEKEVFELINKLDKTKATGLDKMQNLKTSSKCCSSKSYTYFQSIHHIWRFS